MNTILLFRIFIYYLSITSEYSNAEQLLVSEDNSTRTFVELLRGRDGLPGRDGMRGLPGPPGPQGKEGPTGPKSGGTIYTRWGKRTCSGVTGTEEVYSGIAGGTHYSHRGGGANYLCMPKVPEYTLPYSPSGPPNKNYIYGTEYENPVRGPHNHNVPCAVCHVITRSAVVMIPGKTTCPPTWTREYYGYIMSQNHGHHRSMYECVDRAMESLPGSSAHADGALFYHVVAVCSANGLPCPPYNSYKEVNCVVCSK